MAEGENQLPVLQHKLAPMTAERNERFNLATKTTEELKAVEADIALPTMLRKATQGTMDTHTAEIAELQEQLTANGAELSKSSVKHSELIDELTRVKSQSATGGIVLKDRKSAAGNFEPSMKRSRMARQPKESSATPSTGNSLPYWLSTRATRIAVKR